MLEEIRMVKIDPHRIDHGRCRTFPCPEVRSLLLHELISDHNIMQPGCALRYNLAAILQPDSRAVVVCQRHAIGERKCRIGHGAKTDKIDSVIVISKANGAA